MTTETSDIQDFGSIELDLMDYAEMLTEADVREIMGLTARIGETASACDDERS